MSSSDILAGPSVAANEAHDISDGTVNSMKAPENASRRNTTELSTCTGHVVKVDTEAVDTAVKVGAKAVYTSSSNARAAWRDSARTNAAAVESRHATHKKNAASSSVLETFRNCWTYRIDVASPPLAELTRVAHIPRVEIVRCEKKYI
jgi:hypothetical protein